MADSKLLNPSNSSSPPPNCAICLGSCSNKCFSDTCMHQFCFKCLLQWSKIKAECPLCKKPFKSIIHNVKSNEEYEEHIVEEPRPTHIIDNEQYLYLPQSPPNPSRQHRFHFRTTFTVNTHGENAIQQMLLSHSLTNGISISNYVPGSLPHFNRRSRRDNIWTTTSFRRSIYNNNLWASAPGDVGGRYREVTPEFFQANPASRTRLAPWLNRELNALLHENTQDVMQLVDTIMDYLLRYHICSRAFRALLQIYFGERTDHFVHEFYNFMRSPFDMIGYDRHVIYTERPTSPTPFIDLSEDDNSDVMIVEDEPVVIEVSSSDSDDVIMTSFPAEMPKPQLLPACRRPQKRSRHIRLSSSSSSRDREQQRKEDRSRRRKKRKVSHGEKQVKPRPLKLADFVMDNSSSSELDDLPLAKYIRIKAAIGKRILQNSFQLTKRRNCAKKSKSHKKHLPSSSSSKKAKSSMPKLGDLPSTSKNVSNLASAVKHSSVSSSSSSSSSSTESDPPRFLIDKLTNIRNFAPSYMSRPVFPEPAQGDSSSSTSSSSSSSRESLNSRHSVKDAAGYSIISPSTTPPLSLLFKDKHDKRVQLQPLDVSLSSYKSNIDCSRSEESRDSRSNSRNHKDQRSYKTHNNLSLSQNPCALDGPSTSGFRNRSKQKSPKREFEPLKLKIKSRTHNNLGQDSSFEQPLRLTNNCRYSPLQVNPYVSLEEDRASSPLLFTINPNLSRNPVVSQSINFYNSSQSPDLIDLSISKMKSENSLPDPYLGHSSNHLSSCQMEMPPRESRPRQRVEPIPFICDAPPGSAVQPSSSSLVNYPSPFLFKREPKVEPLVPEYNTEGSCRYWTDFAAQSSSLTSPTDSSSTYNYPGQSSRKSVIQNLSNTPSNFMSYKDTISPRWSSSNSPIYPCNTERWSESSD